MSYKKNLDLAKQHGMKSLPYKDLPPEHQAAIAIYMAVDGDAWILPEQMEEEGMLRLTKSKQHHFGLKDFYAKIIFSYLHIFVQKYGKKKFGVVNLPMSVCKNEVWRRTNRKGKGKHEQKTPEQDRRIAEPFAGTRTRSGR